MCRGLSVRRLLRAQPPLPPVLGLSGTSPSEHAPCKLVSFKAQLGATGQGLLDAGDGCHLVGGGARTTAPLTRPRTIMDGGERRELLSLFLVKMYPYLFLL